MKAERAETGYGYIRRGSALAPGVAQADAFVEKPDLETAERFVSEGIYDWNAGIFLFQAKSMVAALEAFVPDLEHACRAAVERQEEQGGCRLPHPASFSRSPAISLDYAVMEKAERIAVVPVALGWSDLGSWDSLFEAGATGPGGNLLTGRVIAKEVSGCLIRSDGPVVAALGISDLVVVAAGGAVLVIPRGQGQRVKELVEALENTPAAAPQEGSEPSDRQ
jgi:mannose-1-phosphate guanylyltransferase/mannose-1-phosphate guanylyltransferase/mannose-6-phosphate isomerase